MFFMSSVVLPHLRLRKIILPPALGALGVLFLALALRLYRLLDNNIWWDEGWTLWLSRLDLPRIALLTAADEHPPLHYWLMHYWMAGIGASAFSGRLFSVFFGILGIAVVYRLAKRIGGGKLGVLAALLLTLSPFHILWSQDIKDYTVSGFFALLSLWCTYSLFSGGQIASRQRRWLWLGYVAGMTLAIYSHYLAALIFLADNLFVGLVLAWQWFRRQKPLPDFIRWSLAQLAVLGLFAPWLLLYWNDAPSRTAAPAVDPGFFVQLTATLFAVGVTLHLEQYIPQVIFLGILAGIGGIWLVRYVIQLPRSRSVSSSREYRLAAGALLGLILISIPPLFVYTLSLTPVAIFHPKIQPRYLLLFLPGFVLLLTLGISWLRRLSKPLAMVLVVAAVCMQIQPLAAYYQGRRLRDDYFTLANTINAFARPGDSILLNTDQEWPTFLYYLRAPIPWGGVSSQPMNEKRATRLASQAVSSSEAVWVVTIPEALQKDPQHLLPAKLAQARPKQFEHDFGDSLLALYAGAPRDLNEVPAENFSPQYPGVIPLASGVQLVGYDLATQEPTGGDTLHFVTYWAAGAPVTVTVELRDARDGVIRADSQVVQRGQRYRIQSDLTLPPRAAGRYALVVRVTDKAYSLAVLAVTPRFMPPPAQPIHNPLDYALGDAIRLRGYNLPRTTQRPGERVTLILFWGSRQPISMSYKVFVQLVGTEFNAAQNNFLWGQVDTIPFRGGFPTTMWEAGDLLPDRYDLTVAPDAPPGQYQLLAGMYDPVTGQRLPVTNAAGEAQGDAIQIGTVTITP
jgi:4-amino-4-deoxy-L-arabinose transferase-like glycosyltransferase